MSLLPVQFVFVQRVAEHSLASAILESDLRKSRTHTHTNAHTCPHTHTLARICHHTYACARVHTYTHTCMHALTHTHMCTQTYTHTHTHSSYASDMV